MKKLIIFVIAALFTISCSENIKNSQINIGVILPLTGNLANQGKRILNGIELCADKIDTTHFKINLIVEDSEGKTEKAVNAYHKLRTINKIHYIIGDMLSSSTLAMAPLAVKDSIILISPTASAPSLSNFYPFFIRLYPSDYFDARISADYCYNELGLRTMAIICWNNDYAIGLKDIFLDRFTKDGGNIISVQLYDDQVLDFSPLITKLRGKGIDGIYLPGNSITNGNIIKKAKEINLKCMFFSNLSAQENDFLKIIGSTAKEVYFSSLTFDIQSKDSSLIKFIEDYRMKYNEIPDIHSVKGFDALNLLNDCFQNNNITPISIINYVKHKQRFNLISGTYVFDEKGEVQTSFSIKTYDSSLTISTLKVINPK